MVGVYQANYDPLCAKLKVSNSKAEMKVNFFKPKKSLFHLILSYFTLKGYKRIMVVLFLKSY